jgi:iron complex transport system substrate-binding protein
MIVAAPDVILMTERTLKAIGGVDSVLSMPGISLTPAGQNRRIIAFDGLALLGFGPRTPATLRQLAAQLHR